MKDIGEDTITTINKLCTCSTNSLYVYQVECLVHDKFEFLGKFYTLKTLCS